MSASRLRGAAVVLREQAAAATEGSWEAFRRGDPDGPFGVCSELAGDVDADVYEGSSKADATYIATVGPTFARAVIPILLAAADAWERMVADTQLPSPGIDEPPAVHYGDPDAAHAHADRMFSREIALADAVLGDLA